MNPTAPSTTELSKGPIIPNPIGFQPTRSPRKRPSGSDADSIIVHLQGSVEEPSTPVERSPSKGLRVFQSPLDEDSQHTKRRSRRRRLRTKEPSNLVTNKSQQKDTTSKLLPPNPDSAPKRNSKGERARLGPACLG
jgi:hypothetical protein